MSVFLDKPRGKSRADRKARWRYRTRVRLPDGSYERIHGTPKINTKAAAQAAERAHIERVLNPPPEVKAAPLLRDFVGEFMANHAAVENKPSEQKSKRRKFDRYILPELGHVPLDAIGKREIDGLRAKLLDGGRRQKKTVNNVMAPLSKLLGYAVDIGIIAARPKMGLFKVAQEPFTFLDFDEYAALLEAAEPEPEWCLAILLGGDAGLRLGEIRAIAWDHYGKRSNKLTICQAYWQDHLGLPKGNRPRKVPATKRLQAAMKRARHLRGPLMICDADGEPLTMGAMRVNLQRLYRKAGINPPADPASSGRRFYKAKLEGKRPAKAGPKRERQKAWHTLRHTFCSHLAMRGAAAKHIQELAGHADLATTLKYMHLAEGETDRAIALLDEPWDHGVGKAGSR